jgi:hypothetical protein
MKTWEMADTYSRTWLIITLYVQCIGPKLYRDPRFGLSILSSRRHVVAKEETADDEIVTAP